LEKSVRGYILAFRMMQEAAILNVAVAGAGRMGCHHARIYTEQPGCRLVGVCDPDPARAAAAGEQFHCPAFRSAADLFAAGITPQAASIAAPTVQHRALAEEFFRRGAHLLIEKPLAPSLLEARAIVNLARNRGCVLQVGHSERFNPVVRALDRHCLKPRFVEVHRVSPMTFRSVDIGVVLDLMIHDIDIVHHFVAAPVESVAAVGVSVIGQFEDIANARLVFTNGCVANLTASRLALKTERRMRLFSPEMYASVDYHKKAGVVIQRTANEQQLDMVRRKIAAGELAELGDLNYTELVRYEPLVVEECEPLRAEIESFLHSVRTGAAPAVTGEDGCFAVDVAARIGAAIAAGGETRLAEA
jgi:predicted dehydrogenase